jgi:hypothetical protein
LWKDKKGYKKLSEKTVKGQNTEKTRKALGKGVVNLLMGDPHKFLCTVSAVGYSLQPLSALEIRFRTITT